jgi:hypothetical protein
VRSVVVIACVITAAGCQPPGDETTVSVRESVDGLADAVRLRARSWDDSAHGGPGAAGLRVALQNVSGSALEQCEIWFGGEFRARLSDLSTYRGLFGGSLRWGRAALGGGESVAFDFHHDNDNYRTLRSGDGRAYDRSAPPPEITLACSGRRATWQLGPGASPGP